MPKKSNYPETRICNPEPDFGGDDWVIWAAWADRITFEEIEERSGFTEAQVISLMRRSLKASSFRRWRKRVHERVSIKHRRRFVFKRERLKSHGLEEMKQSEGGQE